MRMRWAITKVRISPLLPVASLERRARILHAMGEDDEDRGDHKAAMVKFGEAERTTAELLKDAPNDAERVFDQAQSVFWIGEVDFERGRLADAASEFGEYRKLANRMMPMSPENRIPPRTRLRRQQPLFALRLNPNPATLTPSKPVPQLLRIPGTLQAIPTPIMTPRRRGKNL